MSLVVATFVYSLLVACVFVGIWIYYDKRDHDRFETERAQGSYHCVKCGHLYARHGRPARAACPRCKADNVRLKV